VFGIFVLLAHGTWLGLETLDRPVSSLRNWLGVIAVSLASLLPWIPWFWGQARQFTADPWYMEPSPDSLGHLWMELSVGHAGLACMLRVGVVLVLVRASVNEDTSVRSGILFTVSVTVGLVLVPQVLSYGIAPILRPRNVVVWLGCMAVVSGAGWASLQPRVLAASCLGLVLGLQGLAAWRVVFFGEAREQWREIAAVVRSSHVQGERLFANHHQLWAHYLPDLNVESDEQSLPEVGGPYWVLAGHDTNTVAVRATVMLSAQLRDTHLTGARSLWVSPVAWRLPLEKLARKSGVWVGDRVAWYRDGVLRTSPRLLEGRCLIGASGRGDAAAGEPAKLALRVLQDGEVLHADQVELSGERTTIEGAHFDAPASPVEIELAFVNDVFVQSEGESEDRNAYLFQAWVRCE
jgi:hypothetical protein